MIKDLNKGLIVSCQALKNEPLYGGDTIPKMAYAAYLGGAKGIRANTVKDINRIYKKINGSLPIIGIIKKDYPESSVYITPTLSEVKKLIKSKCDVIALDMTNRKRPNNEKIEDLISYIRNNSVKKIMADVATIDDVKRACDLNIDYISTTLRSYTEGTKGISIPDLDFISEAKSIIKNSCLVVEGGIKDKCTLEKILDLGVEYVVIGGAITRPLQITKYYNDSFKKIN